MDILRRYLVTKNRERSAKAALQWLRGPSTDITREMHDMETANILTKRDRLKASELFASGYVKPLGVSMGLMFFQQFSGINAVMFYSVNIFRLAGSSINSNLATIVLGVVNIGATIASNVLIDRCVINCSLGHADLRGTRFSTGGISLK